MAARKVLTGVLAGAAGFVLGYQFYKLVHKDYEYLDYEEEEEEEELGDTYFDPEQVDTENDYSAMFIVRKDLKMGKGKIAAQVGHAALGIFQKVNAYLPEISEKWIGENFPKKFYYCADEDQMDEKALLAVNQNLLFEKIYDAGRTQIEAGSATVLAIGPITEEAIAELAQGLTEMK